MIYLEICGNTDSPPEGDHSCEPLNISACVFPTYMSVTPTRHECDNVWCLVRVWVGVVGMGWQVGLGWELDLVLGLGWELDLLVGLGWE